MAESSTTTPEPAGSVRMFDIDIELDTPGAMLDRITSWVSDYRRAPRPERHTRRVMYANAHVLNQTHMVPELRRILRTSDLVYCDGYGVRLAARLLDVESPHRMTGADWIWDLAALCEERDLSLYLLGSDHGIAARASEQLRVKHPGLRIVGTHHGYFDPDSPHGERVLEDIEATTPDIVLIGMGSPKQELWADAVADRSPSPVLWTVGALFDYVSGQVPRAPSWLADNGWEWIFRLAVEPRRMWKRYLLGNPAFLVRVADEGQRRSAAARAASASS
ncbi:WecB/TagA/CpsF family glycosyltransferase [Patulibacter minatonensis]|uniref:WecB/TagA/CpsF family glycosyltransferase n=1 Tax=Patulibacter minatonensis TaxID=298163 RepID=UPI000A0213BE|nr:WecB/TagA/CpsF family glycosyltransferase [Patulibacter minatonensis]